MGCAFFFDIHYTDHVRRALLPILLLILSVTRTTPAQDKAPAPFAAVAAKADAARDAERLDEAITLYRKALAMRPSWAEGWWSLGTIQYDRNAYAPAAQAFQKVIALAPRNGTAYAMLGLCEYELGRDAMALQHIQKSKSIGLHEDESLRNVVLYHEGVLLQRKGNFQAAQETLEQLCLRGSQGDDVANALGLTMLRSVSQTPPPPGSADADVALRIGRAECLAGQKKFDEARPGFEALVKDYPNYPNVHYAFGLFLLGSYDVPGGVEQLKQEIVNNPGHLMAHLRIAASLYKEDSAAGVPYAETAVKLAPQMGFAHYLLGLLLLDTNEYQRALPELELARKTFPRDAKLYFALGSAYSRAGRKQDAARARATFERLTNAGAESSAASDETGLRGSVQEKVGRRPSPPQ